MDIATYFVSWLQSSFGGFLEKKKYNSKECGKNMNLNFYTAYFKFPGSLVHCMAWLALLGHSKQITRLFHMVVLICIHV